MKEAGKSRDQVHEQITRIFPYSSLDPCGGLSPLNVESVKDKLMRQKLFHQDYQPNFHKRKLQKIFKNVMKIPHDLLTFTNKYQSFNKSQDSSSKRKSVGANKIKSLSDNLKNIKQANSTKDMVSRLRKNVEVASTTQYDIKRLQERKNFIDERRQKILTNEKIEQFFPLSNITSQDLQMMKRANEAQIQSRDQDESNYYQSKIEPSFFASKKSLAELQETNSVTQLDFISPQSHFLQQKLEFFSQNEPTNSASQFKQMQYNRSTNTFNRRKKSMHEQMCERNRTNLLNNSLNALKKMKSTHTGINVQETDASSQSVLSFKKSFCAKSPWTKVLPQTQMQIYAQDPFVLSLSSLVDKIKSEVPGLPELVIDNHQVNAGDRYYRKQAFDKKPVQELSALSNDGNMLLQYLYMNDQQEASDAEADAEAETEIHQAESQQEIISKQSGQEIVQESDAGEEDIVRISKPVKQHKSQNIQEAMEFAKFQQKQDNENFMSEKVIKEFKNQSFDISRFVYNLVKTEKPKVWKPDKFSFGKNKGGKGVGLASNPELK